MSKKGIIGLIIAIVVIIIAVVCFAIYSQNNTAEENNSNAGNTENQNTGVVADNNLNVTNEDNENTGNTETSSSRSKTLVVYYSAQSHTKAVAEKIADNLNADIFEIIPEKIYTSEDLNWNNSNSRVSKEHNDESLRDVALKTTTVGNWNEYDTVLIGYPIWWGIAAWPVDTFVKANDFNGKTVIPFCTSASSGLGQSGDLLKDEANGGNWLSGHRFSSNPSDLEIKNWTDSLN